MSEFCGAVSFFNSGERIEEREETGGKKGVARPELVLYIYVPAV